VTVVSGDRGAVYDRGYRPYEGPRGHREAVAELQRSAGGQFDPEVVAALVEVLEHERRGDEAQAS